MSGQRAGSEATPDHSSALPNVPGIPWWGAIVVAVTATAIGFAYDAGTGSRELGIVFAICYVIGCLAAVLLVRPAGVFTAVIQPPLILFGTVPAVYFLFHSDKIHGLKDLVITCGYPLIQRFPLMFFTSATILVIGLVRHYLLPPIFKYPAATADAEAPSHRTRAPRKRSTDADAEQDAEQGAVAGFAGGLAAAVSAKLTKLTTGQTPRSTRTTRSSTPRSTSPRAESSRRRPRDVEAAAEALRRPRPTADGSAPPRRRPSRAADPAFTEPPAARSARPARPSRPRPVDDVDAPAPPRRSRPARSAPPWDAPRATPPPSTRRDPRDTRDDHGRSPRPEPRERPMRRHRYAENEAHEPYEPRERQPRAASAQPANGARHPVSRVRYRGSDDPATRAERPKERQPRSWEADSWEYDI